MKHLSVMFAALSLSGIAKKAHNPLPTVVLNSETNQLITPIGPVGSDDEEWGSVRLDTVVMENQNGLILKKRRSTLLTGSIEFLESLGLKEGQTLSGQIIVEESFHPFWEGQDPKINPSTDEVITIDGQEVYRNTRYSEDMDENPNQWLEETDYSKKVAAMENETPEAPADEVEEELVAQSEENQKVEKDEVAEEVTAEANTKKK